VAGVPRVVGRDAEIARLGVALASPSALVLIEGEAGIGKSRLVQEALAGVADAMIAICPPLHRGLTLARSWKRPGREARRVLRRD
jgi:predicted ATPase